MNKRRWLSVSLMVFSLVSAILLSGCQGGPTAEEIVAKMQEVEASIEDAHGVLEMRVQMEGVDEEAVVELWEERPNRLRAEVLRASDQNLVGTVSVTDGSQAWLYNPQENQVLVGDLDEVEMDGPTSPREIIQKMDVLIQRVLEISDVELLGEEEIAGVATYKLAFTPKEGEDGSVLPVGSVATVWVEQERWIVLQAHLVGDMIGEGWMHVRSFEFNTGLADDLFAYDVPEGAEVIEPETEWTESLTLDEAQERADFDLLLPGYLPAGSVLIDAFTMNDRVFVFHYDHSAEVSFTIQQQVLPADEQGVFDRVKQMAQEVTVRSQTGYLMSRNAGSSLLVWEENGVTIQISGDIETDEALKVAESLQ